MRKAIGTLVLALVLAAGMLCGAGAEVFLNKAKPADWEERDLLKITVMDFYQNDELVAMTKELTETLRKNKTIDWEKREDARAKMRMMVKKLLKRYKYPPEGMDDAVQTVLAQCELWTDNEEYGAPEHNVVEFSEQAPADLEKAAEETLSYNYQNLK